IGVYALGSFVLGIIVGALSLRAPLQRQLAIAVAVIALTTLPLLFADTVPTLALVVFVSGVAISPTFITAFGLIERHVPAAMLTEGVTWVTTGIGIGMALGSFAAGWMVDAFGPQNGFWVSATAGAIAFATVLAGQYRLATPDCDVDGNEAMASG
ncbi:MAG: MFS transporter, partial [Mesorhizobium sp.]|uniref:MFS transporter n=1 Tax=Mesorhizobium sp. TaxID=1871066 RepID=UPI000FE4FA9C